MTMFSLFSLVVCISVSVCNVYGASKYFLGSFGDSSASFALDQCVAQSDGAYKYTCNSDNTEITASYWSDYGCDGTATSTTTYTSSDATFSCTGVDNYVTLDISVDITGYAECVSYTETSFATNVCYYDSSSAAYYKVTCTDTEVTTSEYSDSDCSTLVESVVAGDCYEFGTFDYSGSTLTARTSVTSCIEGATTTPGPTNTDTISSTDTGSDTSDGTTSDTQTSDNTSDNTNDSDTPSTTWPSVDLSEYHSNYVVSSFIDSISVPFPMGVCVQIGLALSILGETDDYPYAIFACEDDGSRVSMTTYSDSDCTSGNEGTEYYYEDTEATFVCHDENNYASLSLYAKIGSSDCGLNLGTLYAAVGVCFEVTVSDTESYYAAVTCDSDSGIITLNSFSDSDCNDVTGIESIEDCTYFINYDDYELYYEPGECTYEPTTSMKPINSDSDSDNDEDGDPQNGDSSKGVRFLTNLKVDLLVGFVMLLIMYVL